jgi:hypothetical protein
VISGAAEAAAADMAIHAKTVQNTIKIENLFNVISPLFVIFPYFVICPILPAFYDSPSFGFAGLRNENAECSALESIWFGRRPR